MSRSNLKNGDRTQLEITRKDDEIKNLKYKIEKHDNENVLKSPKIDNEPYKKILKKIW